MNDTPRTYRAPGQQGEAPSEGHPLGDLADRLSTTVDRLELAHDAMLTGIRTWHQGSPYDVQDQTGRYIAVDALAALANAQAALANLCLSIDTSPTPWGGRGHNG